MGESLRLGSGLLRAKRQPEYAALLCDSRRGEAGLLGGKSAVGVPKGKLSDDQIMRLERIGMYWGNRNDRQWNEGYQEAKRYFEAHGDLKVPVDYVSPGGYALGKWVKRQRYTRHNPEKKLRCSDRGAYCKVGCHRDAVGEKQSQTPI